MRIEKVTRTIKCDVCGRVVRENALASANDKHDVAVTRVVFDTSNGGYHKLEDICQSCSDKIVKLLSDNSLLGTYLHGEQS